MIPSNKIIKRRCKKLKLKVKKYRYFDLAEEYIFLEKIFVSNDFIDNLSLAIDMVLYPLYVFFQIVNLEPSPMFIFGMMKSYQMWIDFFRYTELYYEVEDWHNIVKKLGGPWIATNDPTYHLYVYADAMERISFVTN
jgi:pyruvate/2-oxoacid:ferredoxin oxidoreductase alpha subunit